MNKRMKFQIYLYNFNYSNKFELKMDFVGHWRSVPFHMLCQQANRWLLCVGNDEFFFIIHYFINVYLVLYHTFGNVNRCRWGISMNEMNNDAIQIIHFHVCVSVDWLTNDLRISIIYSSHLLNEIFVSFSMQHHTNRVVSFIISGLVHMRLHIENSI